MSHSFSYELPLNESPVKARNRVRQSVTQQMAKSAGMAPVGDPAHGMAFAPKWGWPLLVAAGRRASGEKVTVEFSESPAGTNVTVSGKVSGDAEIVSTQEFWTNMLTSAPR